MECTRVFWCVIALTLASMILNVITAIQGIVVTEFTEPEIIVLFPGDEHKLIVDYRTEQLLDSQPESLELHFHKKCFDKNSNDCAKVLSAKRHYLRSFSETEKGECLKFKNDLNSKSHEYNFCVDTSCSKWSGGVINEKWPLNKGWARERPFVTMKASDTKSIPRDQSVVENYFFNTQGYYLYFDEKVPLYVWNKQKQLCFFAKSDQSPFYMPNDKAFMAFHVCKYNNTREAHENAIRDFLGKPENLPYNYESIVNNPIWSTRTRNVNTSTIQIFVEGITNHSFPNGTIEFDYHHWGKCHYSSGLIQSEFKELTEMVKVLNGFNVSLWISPFVNTDCGYGTIASNEDYFVKNAENQNVITTWVEGIKAYIVDFTNSDATYWWGNATKELLRLTGIDTVVFVGGESSWYQEHPSFHENGPTYPDNINNYIETMKRVSDDTQYKSFRKSQRFGHFLRLSDYDTSNNMEFLSSMLISSVINANMLGYPFVIPNMIGGIHNRMPPKNLYIRWMQAVTFMPAVQYSYTPWEFKVYDTEINIFKYFLNLRKKYTNYIMYVMKKSLKYGTPVNPPIWWIDPTNQVAHSINDEYLLGEYILVAPILELGKKTRNIYLPAGLWQDPNHCSEPLKNGSQWYPDYNAGVNTLPWFIKKTNISNSILPDGCK